MDGYAEAWKQEEADMQEAVEAARREAAWREPEMML
jgi:hypothetical protein